MGRGTDFQDVKKNMHKLSETSKCLFPTVSQNDVPKHARATPRPKIDGPRPSVGVSGSPDTFQWSRPCLRPAAAIPGVAPSTVGPVSENLYFFVSELKEMIIIDPRPVIPLIILERTFYVLIRHRQSEKINRQSEKSQHLSFDTIMMSGDCINDTKPPCASCGDCEWR